MSNVCCELKMVKSYNNRSLVATGLHRLAEKKWSIAQVVSVCTASAHVKKDELLRQVIVNNTKEVAFRLAYYLLN
jgi:hypothetical protein